MDALSQELEEYMGLNATVYCDCYERGYTKPCPDSIKAKMHISELGTPEIEFENDNEVRIYDEWVRESPCEHDSFDFVSLRIGNFIGVVNLRTTLLEFIEEDKSLIFKYFLYHFAHTGDHMPFELVDSLEKELRFLETKIKGINSLDSEEKKDFIYFLDQIFLLVYAAKLTRHPICF